MDWIMRTFHSLQRKLEAFTETSSMSVDLTTPIPGQILNDSVYQVCQPSRAPSVEIVFFHGLNLDGARDAYLKTWLSAGGSRLWLEWILEKIPQARILSISYDSFARRTSEHGHMDMYLTCENLVQDLIQARVGQGDCPVVLVGHCIGCLVMKELCARLDSIPNRNQREEDLLLNVKGLFYYACPHHGSELADQSTGFSKGSLFEEMTTLNKIAERRNENFRKLRDKYRWRTYAIQEGRPTTVEGFTGFIVQEASARHGVDGFYTDIAADHFSVCRPGSKNSSSFSQLLDFVTDLLEKDKEEHSPKFDISNGVGLKGRVKTLTEKLDRSQRLGIVGMGGIGKSTLAMALYNIIARSFEYTGFVTHVKESMTAKDDQRLLREKIIGVMDRKGRKVDKSFSWQKLTGKKVLIVLDDVEFKSQVKVMTELDGFSEESRIIVTSRDSEFLSAEGFHCYSVPPLKREESKELLCLNAFKREETPNDYQGRVLELVDKCEGLPLALTVVGKHLHGVNNEGVWDDALTSLRRAESFNGSQKDELWSLLLVSYDSLAPQEKEMFLDVAICFNGEDLEMVKKAWKVCGWVPRPDAGMRNLVNKGLITIVEDRVPFYSANSGKVIRMHEVLRGLGRKIACPDPENTARHSRLSYGESGVIARFPANFRPDDWVAKLDMMQANIRRDVMQANAEVKVLRIDCGVDLNTKELHGLNELKILLMGPRGRLYGPYDLLPPNLACIQCDGEWFPHREGLHPNITESVARNVAPRPALRYLEIRVGVSTDVLDDILSNFPNLQHLNLRRLCGEAIPTTLGNLRSLEHLQMTGCHDWTGLTVIVGQLKSLQTLVMNSCVVCKVKNDLIGQLDFLESLNVRRLLQGPGQVALPGFDWQSAYITSRNLTFLPDGFGWLSEDVEALPDSLGQLSCLRHLDIRRCDGLRALPGTLGNLQALESLTIEECQSLVELPDSLGQLSRLRRLYILHCDGLRALPGTLGNLQALEELTIGDCQNLVELPDSLGQLSRLQSLHIRRCDGLRALPGTIGELPHLRNIDINSCRSLKTLPGNLWRLPELSSLVIEFCENLESFPDAVDNQRRYLSVHITSCNKLKLPSTLKEHLGRQNFLVRHCRYLESHPVVMSELNRKQGQGPSPRKKLRIRLREKRNHIKRNHVAVVAVDDLLP